MNLKDACARAKISGEKHSLVRDEPDEIGKIRRAAWGGRAHVQTVSGMPFIFTDSGTGFVYGASFEDAMADDWEVVLG